MACIVDDVHQYCFIKHIVDKDVVDSRARFLNIVDVNLQDFGYDLVTSL